MKAFNKTLIVSILLTCLVISLSRDTDSALVWEGDNFSVNTVSENIWWLNISFNGTMSSGTAITFPHGIPEDSLVNGLVYPVMVNYYNSTSLGFSQNFPISISSFGTYNIKRYNSTDAVWTLDRDFLEGDEVRVGFGKMVNFSSGTSNNELSLGSVNVVPQNVVLNLSGWNGTISTGSAGATMSYDTCSVGTANTGCAGYAGCSESGSTGRMYYQPGDPFCWWTYDSSNIVSHEALQTTGSFSCTHSISDYGTGCDGTCNIEADIGCGTTRFSEEVWRLEDCYCRRQYSSSCTSCNTYYFICTGGGISNVLYYSFFYPNNTALVINPSSYGNPDYSSNYHWRYDSGPSGTKFNQTGNSTRNLRSYMSSGANVVSFDSSSSQGDGLLYFFFEYQPEIDAPDLENNYTIPSSPSFSDNVYFYAEINNSDDRNLIDYARLTVIAPNGSTLVDAVNGSYVVLNEDYDLNWTWDSIMIDDAGPSDYLWYVNFSDNCSYTGSASNSFHIIDSDVPYHVEIISPDNNSLPGSSFSVEVVSFDSVRVDSCWMDIQFNNGSSWVQDVNDTFACKDNSSVSNLWLDEEYWFFLYSNDTSGNVNLSEPINISVVSDTSSPSLFISYPLEGASYTAAAGGKDNISWYVTDNVLVDSCSLYSSNIDSVNVISFDGSEKNPNNNITLCCSGCTNSCPSVDGLFNVTFGYATVGAYNYSFVCNDSSDLLSELSVSFNVASPVGGDGGGGGGGGVTIVNATVPYCGDGVCQNDVGESFFTCGKDCAKLSRVGTGEMFKESWFLTTIGIMLGVLVLLSLIPEQEYRRSWKEVKYKYHDFRRNLRW